MLTDKGFGGSTVTVLDQLGGPGEARRAGVAQTWDAAPGDPLNVVAVECILGPEGTRLGLAPGLADAAYEDDGQLTKREVRAVTISSLAPAPGELLWDIGGGAGSIAIEWMRTHRSCRAIAVESDGERAARIGRNAEVLGVPALRTVAGRAPAVLGELPTPDAIFIGGGLTAEGMLDAAWAALRPGGRLVANAVTLESEALLAQWYARVGGELIRIATSRARAVGSFTGWQQARDAFRVPAPRVFTAHRPADVGTVRVRSRVVRSPPHRSSANPAEPLHFLGIDDLLDNRQIRRPSLPAAGIAPCFWFVPRVSLLQRGGVDFSRFVLRSHQKEIELVGVQLLARAAKHPPDEQVHLLMQQLHFLTQTSVLFCSSWFL